MQKYRFKIFLFVLVAATVYAACRKTDSQVEKPVSANQQSRFFDSHRSSDPLEKALVNFVKGQNNEKGFVEKVIKQIGYPRWNKAITIQKASQPGLETIDTTITYIPFVRDSQNYVNASLLISTVPGDTTMGYVCDWQYATKENATDSATVNSAEGVALFMMMMDVNVFNHRDFILTDSLLFKGLSQNGNLPTSGNNVSRKIHLDVNFNNNGGNLSESMTISLVPIINWTMWYNYIIDTYGSVAFYLNSPESNGGSGGGSGPGSGLPPGCNEGPVTPGTVFTDIDYTCGPGWVPVPIGLDDPPEEPIDSLLYKATTLANKYRDSLSSLCESQHKERFFNIVNYNNQYDTFRVLIGPSDDEVRPNYNMQGGRSLKGSWHYHPKYSDGTPGSWPSGGDVAQLYDKGQGFVMLIDTETDRYALVVENKSQMNAWENIMGHGSATFPYRLRDSVLADPRVWSTGSTYVLMTKEKLVQALGSSNSSGIGLYQASSTNGTSFIKVN